jgi:hypothetical protein
MPNEQELGFTVNQDDYSVQPELTWEQECRERWRLDDLRYAMESERTARRDAFLGMRIAQELPTWFRWLVCILESLGIWAIFFLLLVRR